MNTQNISYSPDQMRIAKEQAVLSEIFRVTGFFCKFTQIIQYVDDELNRVAWLIHTKCDGEEFRFVVPLEYDYDIVIDIFKDHYAEYYLWRNI